MTGTPTPPVVSSSISYLESKTYWSYYHKSCRSTIGDKVAFLKSDECFTISVCVFIFFVWNTIAIRIFIHVIWDAFKWTSFMSFTNIPLEGRRIYCHNQALPLFNSILDETTCYINPKNANALGWEAGDRCPLACDNIIIVQQKGTMFFINMDKTKLRTIIKS